MEIDHGITRYPFLEIHFGRESHGSTEHRWTTFAVAGSMRSLIPATYNYDATRCEAGLQLSLPGEFY